MTMLLNLDATDRMIINQLQGGFPVCQRPYAKIALSLGITEDQLIARLARLKKDRFISRFGPLYNAQAMGGGVTLAAMTVAEEHIEEVADILNDMEEVAHNYLRTHQLNMWFVVLTESADDLPGVLQTIQERCGCTVYNMPKEKEFFLELKLEV